MDPVATGDALHLVTNPSALAALIAVSFGLIKLLEMTLMALIRKVKPEKPQQIEVQIDPELTKRIVEMDEKITAISGVMDKTDNDGTPMVYSSRSGMEAVRDIAVIIRNVSQTQERLAHVMERLEQKFIDHDRADATVYAQINGSLERLLRSFDDHDRRVMENNNVMNDILRLAQQNNESILKHLTDKR